MDILAGSDVRARLDGNPAALRALREIEATGGEPDVVSLGGDADAFTFCDCAAESPLSRRSCCFDEVGERHRVRRPSASSVPATRVAAGIQSPGPECACVDRWCDSGGVSAPDRQSTISEAAVAPRTASMAIDRSKVTSAPPRLTASASR